MSILKPEIAIARKEKILRWVVQQFVETRRPVGSQMIAEGALQDVSSATIRNIMKELEEDIVTIQDLIALAESNQGKQIFGEEKAVQVAEHAKEIKQQGALYCDCPACTAAAYILEKKDELLKAVRDK